MLTIKKIFFLLMLVPMLTACNEKRNYAYLMRHPMYLHEENMRCDRMVNRTSAELAACNEVKRASADFMAIVNDQQINPEGFGKRVMQAERDCVDAKNKMQAARRALQLQKNQTSAADGSALEKQYLDARMVYKVKRNNVQQLLAAIGTHSPE